MSGNNELARLRGGMDALKHVLAATIRATQPDPTGRAVPPKNVVGIVSQNIKTEIGRSAAAHTPDTLSGESEERAGYTNMLEEIHKSLGRR